MSNSSGSSNGSRTWNGKEYGGSSTLGLGKPQDSPDEDADKRDFTFKASRRPAPPPPSAAVAWPSSPPQATTPTSTSTVTRSNTTSTLSRHRHTSSSSIHAPIPDPEYTVRSQPIGLHKSSSSISSIDGVMEPTISGGLLTRRQSTSSNASSSSEFEQNSPRKHQKQQQALNRPLKHRSESLPTFPPPEEVTELRKNQGANLGSLDDLPANPKNWLPSHLSLYLSQTLQLHPLLQEDITSFIRSSRISGRIFLRLRDEDMEEMGINVLWRPVLSSSREVLRRGGLGGRMWGFGGGGERDSKEEVFSASASEGEEEREGEGEWKNSWRKTTKGKTSGRVKGMAQAFETPSSPITSPLTSPIRPTSRSSIVFDFGSHNRADSVNSVGSAASIDSGSEDSAGRISPFDFGEGGGMGSQDTSPEIGYQSRIITHDNPYGLVRRSSVGVKSTMVRGPGSRMSVKEMVKWTVDTPLSPTSPSPSPGEGPFRVGVEEEEEVESTVKSSGKNGAASHSKLEDLFGLRIDHHERVKTDDEGEKMDVMGMEVGNTLRKGKGSMILVRRSQLEDLQKRLDEVETKLAEALSPSRPFSPTENENDALPIAPRGANLGEWILHSFSAISATPSPIAPTGVVVQGPLSWTALGGYCVAASIGIGIVAGEVVVSKLFGVQLHKR